MARREGLKVWVVTNGGVRIPDDPLVQRVIVPEGLDRADD
ncbi:DUF188 domain-containing protein, partial [Elstera cyanobacteriorum]